MKLEGLFGENPGKTTRGALSEQNSQSDPKQRRESGERRERERRGFTPAAKGGEREEG